MSAEFQIVTGGVLFARGEHVLKSIEGRSQQQVIITVSSNPHVVIIYPAACSSLFQKLEEARTIAAVKNGTKDHTLFATVGDWEMVREFAVPPNIYALEHVHEEEESDEDGREISVDELSEDDRPFHEIECLGHVHHTAEDITTISDEVVNCLNDNPRAHEGRTLGLVGN